MMIVQCASLYCDVPGRMMAALYFSLKALLNPLASNPPSPVEVINGNLKMKFSVIHC